MSKLAEACVLSFNEWIETYPEIMPVAERSEKHEKWKKKLFDKMRNDRYHRLTSKTIKVMLVAAIICALLLSAFVFPSSRETILNDFNIFSTFKITKDNNNYINSEIKVGYIPEGYELQSTENNGRYVLNKYVSSNGSFFTILKHSSTMSIVYNSENNISFEETINDIKYVFCYGDSGINNIVWTKNDFVYQIEAPFKKDELLRIAQTIV